MITYLRHRYLGSKDIFHFSTVALRLTQRFRFAHHKELFGGEQVYSVDSTLTEIGGVMIHRVEPQIQEV